ncbi:TPA: pilin [Vibrio parahaemolyticus]|uniref:pilin n=1 Tax=Vibrio parahaemolyticus TaxID=670 RepID=UPI00146BFB13|nr:pilin [Vibrio parahaemolyticus]MDF4696087.1 pilin [Vibrio parahaemolyticus]MDF4721708.1 pilin [Vibrio parahaemolyticus]MDF5023755.1 pilin [Vibrio parahaemolyticus]MDF5043091.1 pilin [Vibrio parahaemolyticus]MDF5046329.1 pilin [Vibrio parahaemolyticus]
MKQSKQKKQQGFTLIELMIVVAVIGVLAAIAMPQYQKYVAKSEVASVLATLTGAKTNVEAYTVENGLFPNNVSDASPTALGVPDMPLGSVVFKRDDNTDGGTIEFTFTSVTSGASSLVATKNLTLTRTKEKGSWACSSTNLENELLPKTCKK